MDDQAIGLSLPHKHTLNHSVFLFHSQQSLLNKRTTSSPKSTSLIPPSVVSRMLLPLTSRWMVLLMCKCWRPFRDTSTCYRAKQWNGSQKRCIFKKNTEESGWFFSFTMRASCRIKAMMGSSMRSPLFSIPLARSVTDPPLHSCKEIL